MHFNRTSSSKLIALSYKDGYKVCCLWDLYITMGRDSSSLLVNAEIPVVFITMGDIKKLQSIANSTSIEVMIFSRPDPLIYLPTIIIYIIAVLTFTLASYSVGKQELVDLLAETHYQTLPNSGQLKQTTDNSVSSMLLDSSNEIHVGHAVMFVVYCAVLLTLMYFFNLNAIVTVIYVVFSSIACSMVMVQPLLSFLWRNISDNIRTISSSIVNYYILSSNSSLFASLILSHILMFSWYFHR